MHLGKWQIIFIHTSSLFLIVTFLLNNALSSLTLVLALAILGYNIYSILNAFVNSKQQEFRRKAPEAPVKRLDEGGKVIFNAR